MKKLTFCLLLVTMIFSLTDCAVRANSTLRSIVTSVATSPFVPDMTFVLTNNISVPLQVLINGSPVTAKDETGNQVPVYLPSGNTATRNFFVPPRTLRSYVITVKGFCPVSGVIETVDPRYPVQSFRCAPGQTLGNEYQMITVIGGDGSNRQAYNWRVDSITTIRLGLN